MRRVLLAISFGWALLSGGMPSAQAKSSKKVLHSYEHVWPAAVRFLRVDEGLKISEKDAETGYILFELAAEGKVFPGAMELIRRKDSSRRDTVEVQLDIRNRPSYIEKAILDRLQRKIRRELGFPKPPPAPEEKPSEDKKEDDASAKEAE